MSPVDTSDIAQCLGLSTGCYIVKSEKQLPKPMEVGDRDLILSIQPGNFMSQNYTIIPRARLSYVNYNKWSKNKPFAILRDRWLYLINIRQVRKQRIVLKNQTNIPCFCRDVLFFIPKECFVPAELSHYSVLLNLRQT